MCSGDTVAESTSIGPPHPAPTATEFARRRRHHPQHQSFECRPHVALRRCDPIADDDSTFVIDDTGGQLGAADVDGEVHRVHRCATVAAARRSIHSLASVVYPCRRDGSADQPRFRRSRRSSTRSPTTSAAWCTASAARSSSRSCAARRGTPADRRRAGRRQDQPRQGVGHLARVHVEARAVHARPAAHRSRRRQHLPALHRDVRLPSRPAVRQHRARRRDQPGLTEDAVGAARSDGGTAGLRRRAQPPAAARRSWSSPRRTRSSRRAPTVCRRASSTASCCACRSAIPGARPSSRSSTTHGANEALADLRPVVTAAEVLAMIDAVRSVHLADPLKTLPRRPRRGQPQARRHHARHVAHAPRCSSPRPLAPRPPPAVASTPPPTT